MAGAGAPLFYRNPVALDSKVHGGLSLAQPLGFGFSARANAVPISLNEIPLAATWYPIAFAEEAVARPLAVLGFRDGENLFVDAEGRWLEGAYVPAYVRRYPFILAEHGDGDSSLYVDDAPGVLVTSGGKPLFRDGAPTPMLRMALKFCASHRAADLATQPFIEALRVNRLLQNRSASAQTPAGELKLSGFSVVDEHALRSLPDPVFLAFRKQGWLPAIYAHLQSTLNWNRLADLAAARTRPAQPPPAKAARSHSRKSGVARSRSA